MAIRKLTLKEKISLGTGGIGILLQSIIPNPAFAGNNYNSLIPDTSNLKPYEIVKDDWDENGTRETIIKKFRLNNGGEAWVLSAKGVNYAIGVDSDKYKPFDFILYSSKANGVYDKKLKPSDDFKPPERLR